MHAFISIHNLLLSQPFFRKFTNKRNSCKNVELNIKMFTYISLVSSLPR